MTVDAFSVAANLIITGDATEKLTKFTRSIKGAADSVRLLQGELKKISLSTSFSGLSSVLKRMDGQILQITERTKKIGAINPFSIMEKSLAEMDDKLLYIDDTMLSIVRKAHEFSDSMAAGIVGIGASMKGASLGNGGGGGRERKHGGLGGAMRESVAIGGAGGAMRLGGHLGGLALGGAAAAFFGYQGASKFQLAKLQLQAQGYTPSEVSNAANIAMNANIKGVDPTTMMTAISDSAMATKDYKMGLAIAPMMAKMVYANKTLLPGLMNPTQETSAIKFAEMKGGGQLAPTQHALNVGERLVMSSGGNVSFVELRNFMKRGAGAAQHISDKGFYGLDPLIQEMSGQVVGTALSSAFSSLLGGHLNTSASMDLTKLGILKPGAVQYDPFGHKLRTKVFSLTPKWDKLLHTDPAGFAFSYDDMLKKQGLNSEQIVGRTYHDFYQTFARFIILANKNKAKILRAEDMGEKAFNINDAYTASLKTLTGALNNLTATFKTFTVQLGELIKSPLMGGLHVLSKGLTNTGNALTWVKPLALNDMQVIGNDPHLNPWVKRHFFSHVNSIHEVLHHPTDTTTSNVHTTVNIDGHAVVHAITPAMSASMNAPQSSTTTPNAWTAQLPPAFNGGF